MNTVYALSTDIILYVGRTKYPKAREAEHRSGDKSGSSFITEDFEFEILVEGISDEDIVEEEKYWIDCLSPKYNKNDNNSEERDRAFVAKKVQKEIDRIKKSGMTLEQAIMDTVEKEMIYRKAKYAKNKEKIKAESLARYHANRDEINKRRREARAAAKAALSPGENAPA